MDTSNLKANPFADHNPEWMPNLHSDHGQDSNQCARGSQGPQSPRIYSLERGYEMLWVCYVAASLPHEQSGAPSKPRMRNKKIVISFKST